MAAERADRVERMADLFEIDLAGRAFLRNKQRGKTSMVAATLLKNRLGSKVRVIGLSHAKNTDAVCSSPTPEGTNPT
jgi:hypothetical protein